MTEEDNEPPTEKELNSELMNRLQVVVDDPDTSDEDRKYAELLIRDLKEANNQVVH